MNESARDLELLQLSAAAAGLAAGAGVSYIVNYFVDNLSRFVRIPEEVPGFCMMILIFIVPVVVFGIIFLVMKAREASIGSDEMLDRFVIYFEISFLMAYFATYWLYWMIRI